MSDQQIPPISQNAPPFLSGGTPPQATLPLGENPSDRQSVTGIVSAVEAILRQPRRIHYQLSQGKTAGIISVLLTTRSCAVVYEQIDARNILERHPLWASPVKVAGGLLVSGLICLPSLYIFCCLSGSQARLGEVATTFFVCRNARDYHDFVDRLCAGGVGVLTINRIGADDGNAAFTVLARGDGFWAASLYDRFFQLKAGAAGVQRFVAREILVGCGLQMTTALRPIVGKSDHFFPETKQFFLSHWAENLGLTKD